MRICGDCEASMGVVFEDLVQVISAVLLNSKPQPYILNPVKQDPKP